MRAAAIANLAKAVALLVALCAVAGAVGWILGGYRLLSLFAFAAALFASAVYAYGDRFVLGMLGAREVPIAEAPGVHSTVERLAARAGTAKPKLYLVASG